MTGWVLGVLGLAAAGLSARWNWWRPAADGLPVLMYHKIGRPPRGSRLAKLWVSPDRFRWQLRYLERHGYTAVTFSDLVADLRGSRTLPDKPVLITFDDGYQDNYHSAYPILRELDMKANVFLVFEGVDRHNRWHDPACASLKRDLTVELHHRLTETDIALPRRVGHA